MRSEEVTIAEVLKPVSYRTSIIGKWHLGDGQNALPTNQGFDSYFGILYSNDMRINKDQLFAMEAKFFDSYTLEQVKSGKAKKNKRGKVSLMRDDKIIEYPVDQTYITKDYTDDAIQIITESKKINRPFFIYLAYSMPHVPLYTRPEFARKSKGGPYGDTIEEIDFHVGRLLNHLKVLGVDKNTLVIFTSDNGPWKLSRGCGGPSEQMFSTYEGGHRVPCVMRWPRMIPAGTDTDEVTTTLDFMPILARLTGAELPKDRILDGHDITSMLKTGTAGKSNYEQFFYWSNMNITALRIGDIKLRMQIDNKTKEREKPELYNLTEDISESNNLASQMPEKVKEMSRILLQVQADQLKKNSKGALYYIAW